MKHGEIDLLEVRAILGAFRRGRLGHSLILTSVREETSEFQAKVFQLARGLLCITPKETEACGRCDSCLLAREAELLPQHPDAVVLRPDNARGYSVDSVRRMLERFHLSRSLSPVRLAVIHSAHLLSAGGGAAANAFLKMLEEPRPDSFLLLLTDKPEGILSTIRSRSQHYRLRQHERDSALDSWAADTMLAAWEPWRKWLMHGAPENLASEVPADADEFWKDRDASLTELEAVYQALWSHARVAYRDIDRQQGLRVWDFFKAFDQLIASVRNFGNPSLQWLSFRSRASLGLHGDY